MKCSKKKEGWPRVAASLLSQNPMMAFSVASATKPTKKDGKSIAILKSVGLEQGHTKGPRLTGSTPVRSVYRVSTVSFP